MGGFVDGEVDGAGEAYRALGINSADADGDNAGGGGCPRGLVGVAAVAHLSSVDAGGGAVDDEVNIAEVADSECLAGGLAM